MLLASETTPPQPPAPAAPAPWGVYVHIPWCAIRCPYCAFVVDARTTRPERAYTEAVLRQWDEERVFFDGRPHTVYFGGGTPSQADPAEIRAIIDALNARPGAEISAEVNPGKLDEGRIAGLRDAGVNRVSLGVQSFQPAIARRLARAHSARDAAHAYDLARRLGFRSVSIDLMFAVPGQTLADLDADLDRLAADPPDHVSLYGLTLEPGTPFARAAERKPSPNPDADDDLWRAMYDRASERLAEIGIEVYEVSNFAARGHRCAHNEHYWRARPWAGIGTSAHGFRPDHRRTQAVATVDGYLADPTTRVEEVPARALAAELIGSTLRHVDGVDLAALTATTGLVIDLERVDARLRRDTLCHSGNTLRIRKNFLPVADHVAARLCDALRFSTAVPEAVPVSSRARILYPSSATEPSMTDPDDEEPESVALTGPDVPRSASLTGTDEADDPGFDSVNADLALDVPADLLEAALAAVESRSRKSPAHRAPAAPRTPGSAVEIDLDPPERARPAEAAPKRPDPRDDHILKLNARIRESMERLGAMEAELGRETDGRRLAEGQLSELRTAARSQAEDFDRFRQRSRKEKEDAEKVGEERVLRSFLETANNVERAWHHAQANTGQLLSGLQMIVEQFRTTLKRAGVERIPARPGIPFDPEVHEAVLRVPSSEVPPGHIVDEASPGWRLRGRLFQAARVTVADAPLEPAPPPAVAQEPEDPPPLDSFDLAPSTQPAVTDEPESGGSPDTTSSTPAVEPLDNVDNPPKTQE